MSDVSAPAGWAVWSDETGGRLVLVFRPDVFDSDAFPPECLPTIYVSRRNPNRRLPRERKRVGSWYVSLSLEPEVRVESVDAEFETRGEAVAGAVALAERFAAGELDYRDAYQVPREDYLDELDRLTG